MSQSQTAAPPSFPDADGQWRRLSPRMLLVHPVTELIRFIPALVALLIGGSAGGGRGQYWSLIGVALAVGLGVSRWFTTTYRVSVDQVQLRRGLLRKRSLTASLDRVRTVDVEANPMHRLLSLSRLSIGTGVSDRDKGGLVLDGLSVAEADRLRGELLSHRGRAAVDGAAPAYGRPGDGTDPTQDGRPVPVETPLSHWTPAWIRYGPFSLSGLITIGAVAAVLSRFLNEGVDPERYGPVRSGVHRIGETAPGLLVLLGLVLLLVVVAIASTIGYVVAFWNFRLSRFADDGTLHVTRGLLTTRATTIEEGRLRGLEVSRPLLLRAVGGSRLIAIATGLRVGRGSERGGTLLLPPGPHRAAEGVARAVLGDPWPVQMQLRRHGRAATRRRWSRALSLSAVLVVALEALLVVGAGGTGWRVVALLPLPLAAALAADRARTLGHALVGGYLISRTGSLVQRRVMLQTAGVVGIVWRTSYLQRRAGVCTLTAATAAGRQHYEVLDVRRADSVALADGITDGLLEPFLQP